MEGAIRAPSSIKLPSSCLVNPDSQLRFNKRAYWLRVEVRSGSIQAATNRRAAPHFRGGRLGEGEGSGSSGESYKHNGDGGNKSLRRLRQQYHKYQVYFPPQLWQPPQAQSFPVPACHPSTLKYPARAPPPLAVVTPALDPFCVVADCCDRVPDPDSCLSNYPRPVSSQAGLCPLYATSEARRCVSVI